MSENKDKNFFAKIGEKCSALWKKFIGLFKKSPEAQPASASASSENLGTLSTKEKIFRFLRAEQGWLFVMPAVILLCIFTIWPIINAFLGAFQVHYNPLAMDGEAKFEYWGFENFRAVLAGEDAGSADFLQALINTLIFTLISVPLSTLLALLISVALNSIKPLQKAYQTVLFLPYLTNSLAMGAVFATFFKVIGTQNNTETVGLINNVLGLFGIEPIDWIGGYDHWKIGRINIPWTKYIVIIVYEIWSGLPFKILILFSSLQSVNKQYYDAAKIDGASKSRILWHITTPLIMPMISYLLITGIMGGMKQYTAIVGLFGSDMADYQVCTMVGYIYYYIEHKTDVSYPYANAFAGSLILFVIIMIITLINLQISKKKVNY